MLTDFTLQIGLDLQEHRIADGHDKTKSGRIVQLLLLLFPKERQAASFKPPKGTSTRGCAGSVRTTFDDALNPTQNLYFISILLPLLSILIIYFFITII
jgi:hypothetical protein